MRPKHSRTWSSWDVDPEFVLRRHALMKPLLPASTERTDYCRSRTLIKLRAGPKVRESVLASVTAHQDFWVPQKQP